MNSLLKTIGGTGGNACICTGPSGFQFATHQLQSFYGMSDGCTFVSGVLHYVYFCKDSWEVKYHLGCVRLSEIYSKIAAL